MDNFLGAVVFLLPGVLAYFWLQAFGINPVVKHSPTEFTAVAGLLWLPVSFGTLVLYNFAIWLSHFIIQANPIWTLKTLKDASDNFAFLMVFLLLSVIVSFIYSSIWAVWGFKIQHKLVNWIRGKRGLADFSDTTSVWDEVFGGKEFQIIEYGKIDKTDSETVIGCIRKASRPFESERNLVIGNIEYYTKLIKENGVPVHNMYIDTKTGFSIKVFDSDKVTEALATSSEA